MYTPKQPEAHSSQSQWLTWQSTWQRLCTLETPLRLYSRPVLPCSTTSPPYPFMASPTSPYPALHLTCQGTFGTPAPKPSISASQSPMMPTVLETTPHHETGTPYANRKCCTLTLNFLNKNKRQGQSSLYKRSPLDWSKKVRNERQNHVLLGTDTLSAVLY